MKTSILTLTFTATLTTAGICQENRLGIIVSTGMSPEQFPVTASLLVNRENPLDEFRFSLVRNKNQIYHCIQKEFRFTEYFFGNLGVMLSQQQQTYTLQFSYESDARNQRAYDLIATSRTITVPANVGVRSGIVHITSGLMIRFPVNKQLTSDMMMGIRSEQPRIEHGWQAGIGIELWQIRLGIQYQSSFARYGSDLLHHNRTLDLRNIPGNVICSIGLSL